MSNMFIKCQHCGESSEMTRVEDDKLNQVYFCPQCGEHTRPKVSDLLKGAPRSAGIGSNVTFQDTRDINRK